MIFTFCVDRGHGSVAFIVFMKLAIKKITDQQRALNMSNVELASEIGMTSRGFSVMMSRKTTFFQTVERLAKALSVKEKALIEFEDGKGK